MGEVVWDPLGVSHHGRGWGLASPAVPSTQTSPSAVGCALGGRGVAGPWGLGPVSWSCSCSHSQ